MKTLLWAAAAILVPSAFGQGPDQARQLLAKVNAEFSGHAKVRNVSAIRYKTTTTIRVPQGEVTSPTDMQFELPDRAHVEIEFPIGRFIEVVSPESGFTDFQGKVTQLSAEQKADYIAGLERNLFLLLQRSFDPDFSVSMAGDVIVGSRNTKRLKVEVAGSITYLFVDPESGRVLREDFDKLGSDGSVSKTSMTFSDWRNVAGYSSPFKSTFESGDGTSGKVQINEVELNPPANPDLFTKTPILLSLVPFSPTAVGMSLPSSGEAAKGENSSLSSGTITVVSDPGGAQVYVNDKFRGLTSESDGRLVIDALENSAVTLRISLPGYEDFTGDVELQNGASKTVKAALKTKGPTPLSMNDLEALLRNGVSKTRIIYFLNTYGVDFKLSPEAQSQLRSYGADDSVLLAVATSKR
jgi:outer membrane lipoprotein-sorting protein